MRLKLIYCFILLCSYSVQAGDRKSCKSDAPGENIYKHFTGTIGGRKVVLDLRYGYCGASNFGGSYLYFSDNDETKCLSIYEPNSFAHNAELHAIERRVNYYYGNHDDVPCPSWSFVIKDSLLTGVWESADKKTTGAIRLVEDYSRSARLDIVFYDDSAKTMQPGKPMRTAYFTYLGIVPTSAISNTSVKLINNEILKMTEVDHQDITDVPTMLSAIAQQRFNDFQIRYGQLPSDTTMPEWRPYNFSYGTLIFPVYNEHGILSLEMCYTGKMQPHYACIDLTDQKTIKLSDVLNIDKEKLPMLIRNEYIHTSDSETIRSFPPDRISIPEKFMITGKGLLCCYAYNGGGYKAETRVFVSYKKLAAMLNKEFKNRMGL